MHVARDEYENIKVGQLVRHRVGRNVALVVKKGDWAVIIRWVGISREEDMFNYAANSFEVLNENR